MCGDNVGEALGKHLTVQWIIPKGLTGLQERTKQNCFLIIFQFLKIVATLWKYHNNF